MVSYRDYLGQSESSGDYSAVNKKGYTGKYQWGQSLLDDYNNATNKKLTLSELRDSPEQQEEAQTWADTETENYIWDRGLDYFIGKPVHGTEMTMDSMKAVAHLGGKAGLSKFLTTADSAEPYNPSDGETKLSDYAAKFAWLGNLPFSKEQQEYPGPTSRQEGQTTGFDMLQSSQEDYCPAGSVFNPLTNSCESILAPMRSVAPPPRPQPELMRPRPRPAGLAQTAPAAPTTPGGKALGRFGIQSLI